MDRVGQAIRYGIGLVGLWGICGGAMAQTLTLAVGAAPISADPHYSVLTPNVSMASHVYDALINRDAASKPVPGLALSWAAVAPTVTWLPSPPWASTSEARSW